jgi:esterase/lipase
VAVCPPLRLQDFSTRFMPSIDVWNRLLQRMKGAALQDRFFTCHSDNPHINYRMNPYSGIREVGHLLEQTQHRLEMLRQPALILQACQDPVVSPQSSRKVYEQIGSATKEYNLMHVDRHDLLHGASTRYLHDKIALFIRQHTS